MEVLAACLRALYRKCQINKGLRRAGSQQRKSAFRYNAYRPCAPRMAHLSIHGCTCCVPASVVSKVADKQRAVECRELGASSASSAFRYNAYRPCAPRMAHLSIHGCTCCVPASVVSKVADKQRTVESQELSAISQQRK